MSAKILLIEDDASLATGLQRILVAEGYEVTVESRGDTGLAHARRAVFDAVLTDLRMPGLNGLDLVRELHVARPRLPILLMTAHGTTATAIEAIKFGAFDYLLKPFEMEELLALVAKAVAAGRLMTETVELGETKPDHAAIIGNSRAMQSIYKEIGRVAARPVPVLIRGETGTGKELVARAIYQHSTRASAPFVTINCAAIPETLLESELFGHERGAFTGAETRRIGRFEQADGGTIFLDEIGDMSPGTQVKLLRVLQEKTLQRLGGRDTVTVDVRVIAATHRDLEVAIREKQFREDLFYRLNVIAISLPALRERREDIPDLVKYFLAKHGGEMGFPKPSIQVEAMKCLQDEPWPGNVRELENRVRQLLLLARGFAITRDHVRDALTRSTLSPEAEGQSLRKLVTDALLAAQRGELADARGHLLEVVDREILAQAIHLAAGNQAKAARWLGISRLTLREKLTQLGLHPRQSGEEAEEAGK